MLVTVLLFVSSRFVADTLTWFCISLSLVSGNKPALAIISTSIVSSGSTSIISITTFPSCNVVVAASCPFTVYVALTKLSSSGNSSVILTFLIYELPLLIIWNLYVTFSPSFIYLDVNSEISISGFSALYSTIFE